MKTRHLLMLAGLVGAAWLAFFGDRSADTGVAVPGTRQAARPSAILASAVTEGKGLSRDPAHIEAEPKIAPSETEVRILALQPRADLIGTASGRKGNASLFSSKSWAPPPVVAELAPPPPPSAPPLPFTYLGKQTADGLMEVYLARGDEIFVVRDHTVIQNTYRVESIKPPTLTLVYLPLNEIQRLSIGVTN